MKRDIHDYIHDILGSMRDKLIHEYHGIDLEIVWTVIKEELPPLKPFIEKVTEDIKSGG